MSEQNAFGDRSNPENKTSIRPVAREVSERFTRLLAASTISDPDFPSEKLLPRMTAIPFNNLGHQALVDQRLLGKLLWNTFYDLKNEKSSVRATKQILISIFSGLTAFVLLALVELEIAGFFAGGIAAWFAFYLASDPFPKRAAKIKAARAVQIIDRAENSENSGFDLSKTELAVAGTGTLSPANTQVFFSDAVDRRFPGLGWTNVEELFVCPTKTLTTDPPADSNAMAQIVCNAVKSLSSDVRAGTISSGWAVVVDSRTVGKDSSWLDGAHRPLLEVDNPPNSELLQNDRRDPLVSARTFFGTQVLLPEHLTLVTIFVRPFMASTSAAFEMVVMTLGPPISDEKQVRTVVRNHNGESNEKNVDKSNEVRSKALGSQNMGHAPKLKAVSELLQRIEDPFLVKSDYSILDTLKWFDVEGHKQERAEAEKLNEATDIWIGRFLAEPNWREANSLVMTSDFFGRTECRAVIRALYDQVARRVLEALDQHGFDISRYKDSTGQWNISVEKIDQMVVGEKISVQEANEKSE